MFAGKKKGVEMEGVDKKLVNFRCDLDVLDGFDEVCSFRRSNRTHYLMEIMRRFIEVEREEINRWKLLSDSIGKPS